MPLTYAGSITAIANGDPVNAAVANQPHTDLEDRTEEVRDYVNNLELQGVHDRGISIIATDPVVWNGSEVVISNSGSIWLVSNRGGAESSYEIPYNELASFFATGPVTLAEGEVLYVDFADLDARLAGLPAGLVTAAELGKGAECPIHGVPIGRVFGGTFVFGFGAGSVSDGGSSQPGVSIGELKYGDDYVIEGEIRCEMSGTSILVNALADVTIRFNHNEAVTNVMSAASPLATLAVNVLGRYVWVDLEPANDGQVLTLNTGTDYQRSPNRILLFRRTVSSAESALGGADGYLHVVPTGITVPVRTGETASYIFSKPWPLDVRTDATNDVTVEVPSDLTIIAPDGLSVKVDSGGSTDITFTNDGAGAANVLVDGNFGWTSTRTESVGILGVVFTDLGATTIDATDLRLQIIEGDNVGAIIDFSPYVPDGCTITDIEAVAKHNNNGNPGTEGLDFSLVQLRMSSGAVSTLATASCAVTSTLALCASTGWSNQVINKGTYAYKLRVTSSITGLGNTLELEAARVTFTYSSVLRGG